MSSHPSSSNHACGCYFLTPASSSPSRHYLPRAELRAHTTIRATVFNTVLSQVYENPKSDSIDELRYSFPLYDGVSVVGFECLVGQRVIKGIVKEKDDAKATYGEAKSRGEAVGLLEQLPDAADVFVTTIGNVPARSTLTVNIIYVGELKQDAEVDGARFTMPTSIAPRYGSYPGETLAQSITGKGIAISVDINLDSNSRISKVMSPSHQISVSVGTLTTAPDAEPKLNQASATSALGTVDLASDFVLQFVTKDTGIPKAILETHPILPNQRALMTTLVPKFSLSPIRPEIIFVADRSGSMDSNIDTLKAALQVFLKSLPVGVKFNICSFGSSHELLWAQSQTYSQDSLHTAQQYVNTFAASFGGTETQNAVEACIQSRFESLDTEIMLLTDGDIWAQDRMFAYLNTEISKSGGRIRVFPIGIGVGVSSALIEGIARAGNGFAQYVGNSERLDGKIVRMLKGALMPHVTDYTLEVNYASEAAPDKDDEFEIVEKVADNFEAGLSLEDPSDRIDDAGRQKPISLFDNNAADKTDLDKMKDGKHRFDHLPELPTPKLLQVPHKIPPLFPFSRTSAYLLMSPETSHRTPVAVMLRGTCAQGPLELRIPVETAEKPGKTLHCLAAKKAMQELEEGRGWLHDAKDIKSENKLIKEAHSARFDEIVQREAVRLGMQFQVAGKWTSWVAVEQGKELLQKMTQQLEHEPVGVAQNSRVNTTSTGRVAAEAVRDDFDFNPLNDFDFDSFLQVEDSGSTFDFGAAQSWSAPSTQPPAQSSINAMPRSSSAQKIQPHVRPSANLPSGQNVTDCHRNLPDYQVQLMLLEQQNKRRLLMARQEQEAAAPTSEFGSRVDGAPPPPPPQAQSLFGHVRNRGETGGNQPTGAFGNTHSQVWAAPASGALFRGPPPPPQATGLQAQSALGGTGNSLLGGSNPDAHSGNTALFGSAQSAPAPMRASSSTHTQSTEGVSAGHVSSPASQSAGVFGAAPPSHQPGATFGSKAPPPQPTGLQAPLASNGAGNSTFGGSNPNSHSANTSLFGSAPSKHVPMPQTRAQFTQGDSAAHASPEATDPGYSKHARALQDPKAAENRAADLTVAIIDAQFFQGSWSMNTACSPALGVEKSDFENLLRKSVPLDGKVTARVLATVVVLVFLEQELTLEEESWELVSEKGWEWVEEQLSVAEVDTARDMAEKLIRG